MIKFCPLCHRADCDIACAWWNPDTEECVMLEIVQIIRALKALDKPPAR